MPGGGCKTPITSENADEHLQTINMSGKEVYKQAVIAMVDAAKIALEKAGLTIDDIACVIPHQANVRIIEAIADRLKIPIDKFFVNLDRYGNTSAAAVAIALDEANRSGRIKTRRLRLDGRLRRRSHLGQLGDRVVDRGQFRRGCVRSAAELAQPFCHAHRNSRPSRLSGFRAGLRRRPAARDRGRRHAHHHHRDFDREQPARGRAGGEISTMSSPSSAFIRTTPRKRAKM